jgi:hypothetical protein
VSVGDDEAETGETGVVESGEELAPERLVLRVADVDTERLAVAGSA